MKRLRIILQSRIFLSILLIITTIYVFIITSSNYYNSKYKPSINVIEGVITSIKFNGNKVDIILKAKEKIIINYYLKNEKELNIMKKYRLGYKIKVKGTIKLPSKNSNFNSFNYRNYLLSKKIYYVMSAENIELLSNKCSIFYQVKNSIIERLNKINNSDYLNAFLLGNNADINSDVLDSYQKNGISHLFALSGLHVTIFSSIILFILNKIFRNKKINYLFISIFLTFYMFLTGLSPSIIRAVLFFILLNISKYLKLDIKTINLFLMLTCIVLLINPYNIYNIGFLFSYIISFYLIILGTFINKFKNYFIKLLFTSMLSFLVSIPIMINNYHFINIICFIYNLLFVPFISILVFPISLITFICPLCDDLLKILINLLESTSIFLSKIEIFTINLKHIPLIMFFLYYFIISFILIMVSKKRYYYIILVVIIIIIHANYNNFNSTFYITTLDIGQGDSILMVFPHNKGNILIDTGGKIEYKKEKWKQGKSYSVALNTIIPYLKSEGLTKIDYLILSHGDADHMGEAINLVNNFKVEKVIFNCGPYNDLEKELIKVLDKKKINYYSCIKELNIDKNKLYFLQTKEYNNENDNSNVIYTEIDGYKFMFMGDASITTEKEIMSKYNLSNIDVLKVGHHGSKTSSSKDFINKMKPNYSIISVGKNNRYGHPNKEALENLKTSKIYRTDKDGSIMFKIRNSKLQVETCAP